MRIFLVVVLMLIGGPALAQTHVQTAVICRDLKTVENHIDLIEAEDGHKLSNLLLQSQKTRSICTTISPMMFPIMERLPPRGTLRLEENRYMRMTPVRIGEFWTIEFIEIIES